MAATFTPEQLAACPTIRINSKDWPIPIFGPRQNRRIVPFIGKLSQLKPSELSTEDMDNLTSIIFWAINRAHPEVKETDVLDWPMPLDEQLAAIPTIAAQTGLMKLKKVGAADTGEAAATAESPSTGTSSSQEPSVVQDGDGTQ